MWYSKMDTELMRIAYTDNTKIGRSCGDPYQCFASNEVVYDSNARELLTQFGFDLEDLNKKCRIVVAVDETWETTAFNFSGCRL